MEIQNKLSVAKKYCKIHKLRLEDFNEEGYFITSKIIERIAYKESFASKKSIFKRRFFEGYLIKETDCITLKTFGTYGMNCIMFFTEKILNDLKTLTTRNDEKSKH